MVCTLNYSILGSAVSTRSVIGKERRSYGVDYPNSPLTPNATTYSTLIQVYIHSGSAEQVAKIDHLMEEMKMGGGERMRHAYPLL